MKNKQIMYEHKASTRDYYVALAYFPNFLRLLNPTNKPYAQLIHLLLEKEYILEDQSLSLPTIKELSEELHINTAKITKYLKDIYDEILRLNWNEPYLFKKEGQLMCCLSMRYVGEFYSFNIGLDVVPRVGDHFEFYFLNPKLSGSRFYVDKVLQHLDYKGQPITISMSSEFPNDYLKLLKEKAYLHREISFKELLDRETNNELKETLLKRHKSL